MEAEEIVRLLADTSPNYHVAGAMWHGCGLCEASLPTELEDHEPDCPWRLATEWVTATDRRTRLLVGMVDRLGRSSPPAPPPGVEVDQRPPLTPEPQATPTTKETPLTVHYCITSDGTRIVCVCSTGHDHTDREMDQPDESR